MAQRKRTEIQREADLVRMAEMYCRGYSLTKIAEVIGVTKQQLSYDLKEIKERWKQRTTMDLDAKKSEELAKLDAIEMEAWEAFRRSQAEFTAQTVRAAEGKGKSGAKTKEVSKHTESRYGDARFLETALRCVAKRCEMLGLNAPVRSDVNLNPDGIMNDEKFYRLLDLAAKTRRERKAIERAKKTKAVKA